jgi:DNA-binding MarR family transcriptional regulator
VQLQPALSARTAVVQLSRVPLPAAPRIDPLSSAEHMHGPTPGSRTPAKAGKLSVQGRRVLEALARTGDGQLTVGEVLRHVRRRHTSLPVARASLSRTLRRLWTAGFVELWTRPADRTRLTTEVAEWRAQYEQERADPEAAYAAYCRQVATAAETFGSALAYLEAVRAQALRPRVRVRRIALLPPGRATVNTCGASG